MCGLIIQTQGVVCQDWITRFCQMRNVFPNINFRFVFIIIRKYEGDTESLR